MKRGFLGSSKKEPVDSRTIRKSTREVSIDTLQTAAIDSLNQAPNDTVHPVSNNTVQPAPIDTVHPYTVLPDTNHPETVHPASIDIVYPVSIDTVYSASNDIVDENGSLRDEEGRTHISVGQWINSQGDMDEVKAKLDNVHKLLRRQVSLVEDAEAVDTEGREEVEEDVNFISGTDSKEKLQEGEFEVESSMTFSGH
ncbi:hypothetical protein F2Q69_00029098 [Brassica cretica]|uniref:Uncharacterized protein n=1 Tax=Brassica cretica TaxID=69181 RepID=A0A8S9RV58_BRACR|nr:hypothetical protein F2Q69_00029098 [Brassica cretica]